MAMNAQALLELSALLTSPQDLVTGSAPLDRSEQVLFDEGVGANQANRIWTDQRTLGASATEDLDLAGSALLDPFGVTVVFARIKLIYVKAAAGNANNVVVGAASTTQWVGLLNSTGTVTLRPGAWFAAASPDATGMVVGAGSTDFLKVANSGAGTSVTYDIVLIGAAT